MTDLVWRTGLTDAERARITAIIDVSTEADGIAPVGDQVLRELPLDRTRHLLALDGAEVIGYLNLAPAGDEAPPMAEAVVLPDARRRGVGAALVAAGLAAGGPATRIWAHGDLAPAKATAAALGLEAARELWQMRRPLRELPDVPPHPGVALRTYAGPADDAELLRVNNAAFSWHPEQGGWTTADVDERRRESWFDPEGLFLAFDDGDAARLLGFHWTKVHDATLGEVYVVGVDPQAQGRGLGALLTLVGLHYLAARLVPDAVVTLYVEANNYAAVKTYEKLGFGLFSADVAYTTSARP